MRTRSTSDGRVQRLILGNALARVSAVDTAGRSRAGLWGNAPGISPQASHYMRVNRSVTLTGAKIAFGGISSVVNNPRIFQLAVPWISKSRVSTYPI
jgi:hypothetical protein